MLPLDDRFRERVADPTRPLASQQRDLYRYFPGTSPVPNQALPLTLNCRHSFTAQLALNRADNQGFLVGARENDMSIAAPKIGMRPVHAGELLREDYLKPLGMSANALALAVRVPASRIDDIVLERRGITVDTAMRLVRYFGGDVQSWMNLQTAYEVKVAQKTLARKIEKEVLPMVA